MDFINYYEEGYIDADYYRRELYFDGDYLQAGYFEGDVTGNIVEATADLVAEFTQTATLSAFDGSDMFAFAEAQLAIEVSLIRDNNIATSAVFDCATDGRRFRDIAADADSNFNFNSTVERSRDYQLHAEAAFSFDVVNDKIVQAQAQVTAESTVSATISHIQGADIVVDNFATVTAAVNVVTENTSNLAAQFDQSADINTIVSAVSTLRSFFSVFTSKHMASSRPRNWLLPTGGSNNVGEVVGSDVYAPRFGNGSLRVGNPDLGFSNGIISTTQFTAADAQINANQDFIFETFLGNIQQAEGVLVSFGQNTLNLRIVEGNSWDGSWAVTFKTINNATRMRLVVHTPSGPLIGPTGVTLPQQTNGWRHLTVRRQGSTISARIDGTATIFGSFTESTLTFSGALKLPAAGNRAINLVDQQLSANTTSNGPVYYYDQTSYKIGTSAKYDSQSFFAVPMLNQPAFHRFLFKYPLGVTPTPDDVTTVERIFGQKLTAVSTLTVTISGPQQAQAQLNSVTTLTAAVAVDRGADLEAFAEAALAVDATRIRSVSSDLSATGTVDATVTALKTTAVDLVTDTSADVTGNVIVDAVADFDSVATKLAIAVKVGSVIIHAEVSSTTQITADKITDVSQQLASEFAVNVSSIVGVDFAANLVCSSTVTTQGQRVRLQAGTGTAEFLTTVSAAKTVTVLVQAVAQATVSATSTGTIGFSADLNDAFDFGLQLLITRSVDIDMVVTAAANIETNNSLTLGGNVHLENTVVFVANNARTRQTTAELPSVSTKLVAVVITTNTVSDMLAEFAVEVSGDLARDNEIDVAATSELTAAVVKTTQVTSQLLTSTAVLANVTSSTDASALFTVESTFTVQGQKTTEIILSAFSDAAVVAQVQRTRGGSGELAAITELNIAAIKILSATAFLTGQVSAEILATRVALAEADLLAFNTTVTVGRVPTVDRISHKIAPETRLYTIASETRLFKHPGETRIFKIRSK